MELGARHSDEECDRFDRNRFSTGVRNLRSLLIFSSKIKRNAGLLEGNGTSGIAQADIAVGVHFRLDGVHVASSFFLGNQVEVNQRGGYFL